MKKLTKEIKELQKEISEYIANINNGGCIQFAYFFSKKLKELKIPYKICLANDREISFTYNKFNPPEHVLVYIPKIGYVDGKRTFNFKRLKNKYQTFRTKEISLHKIYSFKENYSWNYAYNKNQNGLLEKLINDIIKNAK